MLYPLHDGGVRWSAQPQRRRCSQADVISLRPLLLYKPRFTEAGLYLETEDGVMEYLCLQERQLGLVSLSGFNLVAYSNVSNFSGASHQAREGVKKEVAVGGTVGMNRDHPNDPTLG